MFNAFCERYYIIAGFVAPISVPLVDALMFGKSQVLERLSNTAQNELANIVTILLGITIGSTMSAEKFIDWDTLKILAMGLVAFIFDTAGGVLFAKLINLFLPKDNKINPMVGAGGMVLAVVPMLVG